jgi:PAS domain S-box-containing protein
VVTDDTRSSRASPDPEVAELRARIDELEREVAEGRSARAFLEEALDHVPVGLELYDEGGTARWLNRAMVEFIALPSAELAVGKFNVLTDPFSAQTGMVEFFRRAYAGELVKTREFSIDTELATLDWGTASKNIRFRMVLCPRRDEGGAVKGVLAIMYEVTQQQVVRQIADRILQSHAPEEACEHIVTGLAGTMDSTFARVWLLRGEEHDLRLAARAASRPHHDAPLAHPAVRPSHAPTHLRAALDSQGTVVVHRDDAGWDLPRELSEALGLASLVVTPIRGLGGPIGLIEVGATAPSTAAQVIPAALERLADQYAEFDARRLAQSRFESVFARSPDAVVLLAETGETERSNEAARRLFGRELRRLDDLLVDAGAAAALLRAALAAPSDAPTRWHELAARRSDGSSFPAEVACSRVAPSVGAGGSGLVLVVRDLSEREAMLDELSRSVRAKDTLLREVHHRVKNNLQIMSSLLAMQADAGVTEDTRRALDAATQRVRAMSLVHQQLDGSVEFGRVDLGRCAQGLVAELQRSSGPGATFRVEGDEVLVSLDQAVPLALLLLELLTSAMAHGRAEDGRAEVCVRLIDEGGLRSVSVLDRAAGWAPAAAPSPLGLPLAEALARQLGAALRITARSDGPGTSVTVELPPARP